MSLLRVNYFWCLFSGKSNELPHGMQSYSNLYDDVYTADSVCQYHFAGFEFY